MNKIKFDHLPHEICRVTSPFGYRISPITGAKQSYHQGIDIGATKSGVEGDKLFAVADGKVVHADYMSSKVYGYGYFIIIQHKEFCTLYAHKKGLIVKVNHVVKAGQVIGYMGSTGASTAAHLHFEVQPIEFKSYSNYITSENGIRKYAVDPYPFIEEFRNRQEVDEEMSDVLKLSEDWQWDMLLEQVQSFRAKGLLNNDEWEQKIKNKTITAHELAWLNTVLLNRLSK